MSKRLVAIAARFSVAEADVLRLRLALHGIPCAVDNAVFLLWYWHLGVAVQGVKLWVLEQDAAAAQQILLAGRPDVQFHGPEWHCSHCHAQIPAGWHKCWACGSDTEGRSDPDFYREDLAEPFPPTAKWASRVGLVSFMLIVLLLPAIGIAAAIYFWLLLAVVNLILYRFEGDEPEEHADGWARPVARQVSEGESPQRTPAAADQLFQRRFELAEQIALRAWRAAVLGVFCIPPLILYSIWLLYRSCSLKVPLSSTGRWRWWAALAICSGAVSPLLLFYLALWLTFWDMKL